MSSPLADVAGLFIAKTVRTFNYGALGIVLPVYLAERGMSGAAIGAAVTLMLASSATLTWAIRRPAERYGPRAGLVALAALTVLGALLMRAEASPWLVIAGAMLANVAVGAGETGPFLTLEQVVIARAVPPAGHTRALSLYNLVGYGAAAGGAAAIVPLSPRAIFTLLLLGGVAQLAIYARLTASRRAARAAAPRRAGPLVRRLAALFALDAFAGGFVVQSLIVYFLHARYGLGLDALGPVFFVAQLLTAASLLLATPCARRFGLLATMVVSHLGSNVLLILVAFAPTAALAVGLLYARFLLSQIDVPTRQAYLFALVADHEREGAVAVTNATRTVAQAVSPALTGWIMNAVALSAPFVVGGALKIVYDLTLWAMFRHVPLPQPGENETTVG